jgi:hypothetical protein
MKRMSDKARKKASDAKPIGDALRSSVGRCEICGRSQHPLDVHEISRGRGCRQKALDKPYALLVVCRWCREDLGSAKEWPEARQLAVLAERRLTDWNLAAYLDLTSPRDPRRITLEEVVEHMSDEMLKVDEVADRMRVNRRTVQSWIDSGQLLAVDVRPHGAQRAMWRVHPKELLVFAQRRKSAEGSKSQD